MSAPVPARPAATVLLLRDGAHGLDVFMVKRHHAIDFASGALVFPGGKVEERDGGPEIAAIREAFEEAGLLLARDAAGAMVGAARLETLQGWRRKLESGAASMAEFAAAEGLRFATDALVPFARWITPTFMPKRFDTWFYLAQAPEGQVGAHDGGESVDSLWVRPGDALADATATIVFATRMQLERLGESAGVVQAMAAARAQPLVPVTPELDEAGAVLRIPADAGYRTTEVLLGRAAG